MRIHTNTLQPADLWDAQRISRVSLDFDRYGSRSRDHAFDVTLRGESNRKPNYGTSRSADRFNSYEKAATWDQWGVFLAVLFDRDVTMSTPYYENAEAFHAFTGGRFRVTGYWPTDAHGDHTFRYFSGAQRCNKCSAVQIYPN